MHAANCADNMKTDDPQDNPADRLGICTWSIDRNNRIAAIRRTRTDFNLDRVHLGIFDEPALDTVDTAAIQRTADEHGLVIEATFIGFTDLDRTSVESVGRTGGLIPDEFAERRLDTLARGAQLTQSLGVEMMAAHLGRIPADPNDPLRRKLLTRVAQAAETAAKHGVTILAETGQESASTLAAFLDDLGSPDIAVNFDPANFVLLGTDDPLQAAEILAPRTRLVHLKDALPSNRPGQSFGRTAILGTGVVDFPAMIQRFATANYSGPWIVEQSGETPEIQAALQFSRKHLS